MACLIAPSRRQSRPVRGRENGKCKTNTSIHEKSRNAKVFLPSMCGAARKTIEMLEVKMIRIEALADESGVKIFFDFN